jgi:hypothetical protein
MTGKINGENDILSYPAVFTLDMNKIYDLVICFAFPS